MNIINERELKMLLQNLSGIYNSLALGVEREDVLIQVEIEMRRVKEIMKNRDINCENCGCTEFLCGHNKRD